MSLTGGGSVAGDDEVWGLTGYVGDRSVTQQKDIRKRVKEQREGVGWTKMMPWRSDEEKDCEAGAEILSGQEAGR